MPQNLAPQKAFGCTPARMIDDSWSRRRHGVLLALQLLRRGTF